MAEPNNNEFDYHAESHASAEVGEAQEHASADSRSNLSVAPDTKDDDVVTWEASEYIHHQKGAGWYLALAGITLVLCALLYVFLKDWFAIAVVILMSVALGVYANRAPKVQRFSISRSGLSIGVHHYQLSEFSSYQIEDDGAVQSATFIPLKRFMPPVSVYFLSQDGAKIMAVLGSTLPQEEHKPDIVDRLMRRIRF